MKTRLVFVRHGESTGNQEVRMYGHYNGELTDKGRRQAQLTAEYLKDWNFDAVYSSDLVRAYETCSIIAAYHPGLEIIKDTGLREIFIGKWENMLRADVVQKYSDAMKIWVEDIWNAHPTGGESVKAVTERLDAAVWRIAAENPGKTVLVTGHAVCFRTLNCAWLGMPREKMNDVPWLDNASVSVIDYDAESHTIQPVIINESSFHGDLRSTVWPFDNAAK